MADQNTMNLIAIPFAGGDCYSFRSFQSHLGSHINWRTLELPGRGSRRKESPAETFEKMVESLLEQSMPIIENRPFAIYGHSMGSILGYELVCQMQKRNLPPPAFVFFTGAGAPGFKPRIPIAHLESPEFWVVIAAHNGVPELILQNEDLKNYFEPVMRKDFLALEEYCNSFHHQQKINCPVYLRWGNDESIVEDEIFGWQNLTKYTVEFRSYQGDHFAYIKNPIVLCGELNDLCSKVK